MEPSQGLEGETGRAENPWREAASLLAGQARRRFRLVLAIGLACGALAGLAKFALPATYKSSAQILIDPGEFRILGDDKAPSAIDANAAINYVESQMGVIGSERVLLRVVREQGLAGAKSAPADDAEAAAAGKAASAPPQESGADADAARARLLAENKALIQLQKAVTITRAERSFLVNITVADKSPEHAAELANAVVEAYGEVNAIDRMAAARRLASDLSARVDDLKGDLGVAETKLLNFKIEHNLVGMNEKAVFDRRVSETTDALAAADNREAQARARLKQLESAPSDLGAVSSFGPDPESRQLQVLVEGRAAARGELEQLQSTLGDLHPAVVAGKARLREFDRRIAQALEGLRRSAKSQAAEAQSQAAALNKKLAELTDESNRARKFDGPMHELEADVDAKRKALAALQGRWREAEDMSQREAPNFRIISPARAPSAHGKTFGAILWTVAGGVIGVALAIGGLALLALVETPAGLDAQPGGQAGKQPEATPRLVERENESPVACLGDLPAIAPLPDRRPGDRSGHLTEAFLRPDSAFSRSVETIYQRLRAEADAREADDDRPLVVLVAASWPEAGASTLAANLARVAAAHGERTLVIDAHAAHPAQDRAATRSAPRTLIEAAGRARPLLRLPPYSQSLSLIPSWPAENEICAEIARKSQFKPVAGLNGHFDFVVMDGPDASDEAGLSDLAAAADQVLLVVSGEDGDEEDAPDLLRRIGAIQRGFAAYVRAPRVPSVKSEAA
jgi:polysaccharide biosynthesis transport protein